MAIKEIITEIGPKGTFVVEERQLTPGDSEFFSDSRVKSPPVGESSSVFVRAVDYDTLLFAPEGHMPAVTVFTREDINAANIRIETPLRDKVRQVVFEWFIPPGV